MQEMGSRRLRTLIQRRGGDEEERNQAVAVEADRERTDTESQPPDDGEGSRVRSELARDLIRRVDALVPLVGDVALATNIQLLKRDLSRCHDALAGYPSEGNFLSIVTLIESATAQTKWKQYTRSQLETIRTAMDTGYRQVRVGFDDYEKTRMLLSRENVDTTPRIDLGSLTLDDIADEEEG